MLTTTVILIVLVFATIEGKDWHRYDYPNPRLSPEKCGRNKVSYICDPDQFLESYQADQLDKEIELVMNYTKCPCAGFACDKGTRGYKIGVAIVDKIKKDGSMEEKDSVNDVEKNLQESLRFCYTLLSEWNLGDCEEDLILFYSVQDHVVYTSTNDLMKKKLSNIMVGEIIMAHRMEFQNGEYFSGLKSIILDYKSVLMDEYDRRSSNPSGPQYAAVVGSESAFVFPCFTSVILLALVTCLLH